MKNYDEASVLRVLAKNPGVKVTTNGVNNKTIEVQRDCASIGNSTWGKIDFLVKYKGYTQIFVGTIIKSAKKIKPTKVSKDIQDTQDSDDTPKTKSKPKKGLGLSKTVNKIMKMKK